MPTDPPAQPPPESVVLVDHERDHNGSNITELEEGLAPELVGWLEGLFHGIQTTLLAQQMAARAQFEEMRRRAALAGGDATPAPDLPGGTAPEAPFRTSHGPYL
ncbi:MAG: DUF2587 domain-containing protein [Candidatus Nanopelagicales bacterium]|nr:DUF2587 domain-containing protein [Candidatus Nanopelagicales bacterium]